MIERSLFGDGNALAIALTVRSYPPYPRYPHYPHDPHLEIL